ncbi:MAG: DUF1934 domain-containing protein [Oscillospiraceae bacterium]
MKENFLINIIGEMDQQGEKDTVNLLTRGSFQKRNGRFYITYEESEATGYEGNTTTVRVEDENKVSMLRYGPSPSQLIIERGKRHVCHYDSGYGSLSLGVAADEIQNHLTEEGGDVTFSYTLDTGSSQISYNKVKITVQETRQ